MAYLEQDIAVVQESDQFDGFLLVLHHGYMHAVRHLIHLYFVMLVPGYVIYQGELVRAIDWERVDDQLFVILWLHYLFSSFQQLIHIQNAIDQWLILIQIKDRRLEHYVIFSDDHGREHIVNKVRFIDFFHV